MVTSRRTAASVGDNAPEGSSPQVGVATPRATTPSPSALDMAHPPSPRQSVCAETAEAPISPPSVNTGPVYVPCASGSLACAASILGTVGCASPSAGPRSSARALNATATTGSGAPASSATTAIRRQSSTAKSAPAPRAPVASAFCGAYCTSRSMPSRRDKHAPHATIAATRVAVSVSETFPFSLETNFTTRSHSRHKTTAPIRGGARARILK
mmetsp:Transcript_11481/g.42552  ORF Transcript_11481/g.42552 Transcript_11481/m.42552 type:complete len:213 (-) Transcript_11481:1041-1679(-)